jgi:hypothetical protein
MTCRQNLILGLFVALSLSPTAAKLTNAAAQPVPAADSTNGDVPEITLRRSAASAAGKPAAWKSSSFDAGADIRFKKPGVAAPNAVAAQHVSNVTGPTSSSPQQSAAFAKRSNEPAIGAAAASQSQAPKIEQNRSAAQQGAPNLAFSAPLVAHAATTPAQVAEARPLAKIAESAYAPVTQAIAAVERADSTSSMSLAAKLNLQAAAGAEGEPATAGTAPPEVRLTDEQLQLVSRILMDHQVIRAAQEETLPPAPGDVNNGTNGTKHDVPHLDGDPMYYGECCPPQPRLFWTAGVEATFLNPDLNTDGVSVDVEEIDENRHDICTTLSNDIDSIYVSPRIWLGVQGCAWGANLRYWHLQASEGAYDPSIGGLGTWTDYDCGVPDFGFTTCSRLEAYTIDLELTRRFCLNDCAMQAAMGIRHAEIDHDESLWALANADQGLLTGMARANRLSRGTGLQFGLYGRKPIFPCSCVHWFYNARWSALWGPTQTSVETFASVHTIADPNISGSAASVNGAYTNVDDTLFIGELQLGLEWDYCLQCVPANAFFRAALEYQRWDGGKGFSQSQSFAGAEIVGQVDPVSIITANAAASVPQMDLIGIALSTGLTW